MVKTTTKGTKAYGSTPEGARKFSREVLLQTEKIIKFSKQLQDFILLQEKEILNCCIEDTTEGLPSLVKASPSEAFASKRKPGRPPKRDKEVMSEPLPPITNNKPLLRDIKSETRIGGDIDNLRGSPLSRGFPPEADGFSVSSHKSHKSKSSFPPELIKAIDDYILSKEQPLQQDNWPNDRYEELNDDTFVSASDDEANEK